MGGHVTTMKSKKKKSKPVPKGYDSRLEYDLHKNELKNWVYHPSEKIEYVSRHKYEPDFTGKICMEQDCSCDDSRHCPSSKEVVLEVKGRFRTRQEATKYIFVQEALTAQDGNKEVVFVFQDATKPMPFASKRKDGTKQTHGEWADKNGFKYECCKKGLGKWLNT